MIPTKEAFNQIIKIIESNHNNTDPQSDDGYHFLVTCLRSTNGSSKPNSSKNLTGSIGKLPVFAKIEKFNDKDQYKNSSIERELLIGKQLNEYRDKCYNFTYTLGTLSFPYKSEKINKYLFTEYGVGKPINNLRPYVNFNVMLEYFQQVLITIKYLNEEIGFVHKDLIDSNVVATTINDGKTNNATLLTIGDTHIYTNTICQIYDFDQTHTNKYPNMTEPDIFYDILTLCYSFFSKDYIKHCDEILNYFGFPSLPEDITKIFPVKLDDKIINNFLKLRDTNIKFSITSFVNFCQENYKINICKPEPGRTYSKFAPTHIEANKITPINIKGNIKKNKFNYYNKSSNKINNTKMISF